MANPHKGEVAFKAGDATYTLRFSIDALCSLEDITGKGIIALSNELSNAERLSVTLLRQVLWAGLQEHHKGLDLKEAGELIAAAGGVVAMVEIIARAFEATFPEKKGDGVAHPPKAGQPGTGPRSSVRGAA